MTEAPFYPEVAKLARFVEACIDRSQLSINAYQKRYADKEPNRIVYTTLRTIVRAQNRPDTDTLKKLAKILSASEGKKITWGDLSALIDEPGAETDSEAARLLAEASGGKVVAERIEAAFRALDPNLRLDIAPEMLRQIADDVEFYFAADLKKAGLLIQKEAAKRGVGISTLANEVGVSLEILQSFISGQEPKKLSQTNARRLANGIRNATGTYSDEDFWMSFVPSISKNKKQ